MTHGELALENFRRARFGGEVEAQHPGLDWRVTMFFYAAVHAVNNALFGDKQAPRDFDHDQRRQKLKTDARFASVVRDYIELERLSRQARYLPEFLPMVLDEYREARDRARRVMETLGLPPG